MSKDNSGELMISVNNYRLIIQFFTFHLLDFDLISTSILNWRSVRPEFNGTRRRFWDENRSNGDEISRISTKHRPDFHVDFESEKNRSASHFDVDLLPKILVRSLTSYRPKLDSILRSISRSIINAVNIKGVELLINRWCLYTQIHKRERKQFQLCQLHQF